MIRRINELEVLPTGWGVAWFDYASAQAICMPMPLNKLAGLARNVLLWLCLPVECCAVSDAYARGREDGRRQEQGARQSALRRAYWQGRDHEFAFLEMRVKHQ